MTIQVVQPGLLTTVQDLGRRGYQKYGVIASGAMDEVALRVANLLVGNAHGEAALEMTVLGPEVFFAGAALIAVTGGDLSPRLDGQAVPLWRPVYLPRGGMLRFGPCAAGCRAYLAVAGGLAVPVVMNSRSTYLRAGLGGFRGRALQAGDVLPLGQPGETGLRLQRQLAAHAGGGPLAAAAWCYGRGRLPREGEVTQLRALPGRQHAWFDAASRRRFFSEAFQVTLCADRMGYRLFGPQLSLEQPRELLSEAVAWGTVQVPADGQPIVLLADRQTVGGYPKIAQVARVDLPLLAQVQPGGQLSFREIALAEAQRLYLRREQELQTLQRGIAWYSR